jgi:hypothetical protein
MKRKRNCSDHNKEMRKSVEINIKRDNQERIAWTEIEGRERERERSMRNENIFKFDELIFLEKRVCECESE